MLLLGCCKSPDFTIKFQLYAAQKYSTPTNFGPQNCGPGRSSTLIALASL